VIRNDLEMLGRILFCPKHTTPLALLMSRDSLSRSGSVAKFLKIRVLLLPGAMDTWPSIQMQILALIILILAIWTFVW
jgi:hypothetical protein